LHRSSRSPRRDHHSAGQESVCNHVPVFCLQPPDRCPGVLRPHFAADGALLRIRIPGGHISRRGIATLSQITAKFGDGNLHLTSRGNVQIRGIPVTDDQQIPNELPHIVAASGFLPSSTHDRVRNIVASPLSGIIGGRMDVRPLVSALDRALCTDPRLAELPGRFLFGLDDGRGDLAGMPIDLGIYAIDERSAQIRVGTFSGPVISSTEIVDIILDLAHRFLDISEGKWNVVQLPKKGRELLNNVEFSNFLRHTKSGDRWSVERFRRNILHGIITISTAESAVAGSVPLGVLTPPMQRALLDAAEHSDSTIILTPWRGVIVTPVPTDQASNVAALLQEAGLVLDPASPWSRISACIGSPGCARSRGDTRSQAVKLVRRLSSPDTSDDGSPYHIAGCERACGAPHTPHTLVLLGSST